MQFPHTEVSASLIYSSCQTTILAPPPASPGAHLLPLPQHTHPDAISLCLCQGTFSCHTKIHLNVLPQSHRWNSSTQNCSIALFCAGMEVASADLVYLNTPQLSVVEDSVFGSWNNHYERYPPGNVTKDTGLKIVNQK